MLGQKDGPKYHTMPQGNKSLCANNIKEAVQVGPYPPKATCLRKLWSHRQRDQTCVPIDLKVSGHSAEPWSGGPWFEAGAYFTHDPQPSPSHVEKSRKHKVVRQSPKSPAKRIAPISTLKHLGGIGFHDRTAILTCHVSTEITHFPVDFGWSISPSIRHRFGFFGPVNHYRTFYIPAPSLSLLTTLKTLQRYVIRRCQYGIRDSKREEKKLEISDDHPIFMLQDICTHHVGIMYIPWVWACKNYVVLPVMFVRKVFIPASHLIRY